jgi:hypothetical protein
VAGAPRTWGLKVFIARARDLRAFGFYRDLQAFGFYYVRVCIYAFAGLYVCETFVFDLLPWCWVCALLIVNSTAY